MGKKVATAKARKKVATAKDEHVTVKPQRLATFEVSIVGTSPLVMHAWSEKAIGMMRRKQAGERAKNREVRDTEAAEAECEAAAYRLHDGRYGIPARAVKSAVISAADKDLGLPKTHVRKGMFIHADEGELIAIETVGPKMREDMVRVGQGSSDLRYRPMFEKWRATLRVEIDQDIITPQSVVNLLNRAGFGVGICENRPEKGGDWGRFAVEGTVE